MSSEINKNNQFCLTIFPIPNSSPNKKITLLELLNEQALDKIANFQDRIFMSSPDLICVIRQTDNLSNNLEELIRQQAKHPQSLEIYNFFQGKLSGEDIKAIFSVKTSYRPDRRYQPLFEAAIIKSISYVLDQSWQYYMISNELSQADINLFKSAISPHGIILQEDLRLIDETFLLSTPQDLKPIILKILDYYQNNLS
jgi:hypothetical protein